MRRVGYAVIVFITSVLLSQPPALAQNPSGSLHGIVQDSAGAWVFGAQVSAERIASAQSRQVTSDARGEFRIDAMAPGVWHISVDAPGFAVATSNVAVAISSVQEISVTMRLFVIKQTVNVMARGSSIATQAIDRSSSVHQGIVTSEDLANLPLPARSFANMAYLAPGTEPLEPSDPTKARITAVSTGGSSGLNNALSVDGGDNSDDFIGGFLQNFSTESIEEFAVQTAQEDADTGGTTAGSIVITTKSGSNNVHGQVAFFERAADLNARYPIENPAPNSKQPFSRQNYVGTLSGAIAKDKVFFFTSFETVHENASISYSPANSTQFNALSKLAGEGLIPGVASIAVPANVTVPFRDYLSSLRLDWSQSARSQWFLRASNDTYSSHNNSVQQGTLPSTGLLTRNNYLNMVIANQFSYKPGLLGIMTLNASGLHLNQSRNSNLGFALAFPFSSTSLTVSGFETYGDNQFVTPTTSFPSARKQQKYQLRYDMSYTRGRHSSKAGGSFIHEPVLGGMFPGNDETLYRLPQNPEYYLTNSAQFIADLNSGSTTSNHGGTFAQNVQRLAGYLEDSWQAFSHLTLNYGLRYSTTYGLLNGSGRTQVHSPGYVTLKALGIPLVNGAAHDDRKQVAPRVGFAWSPGNGKTVVRGGFGLYFNDLAQGGWATALEQLTSAPASCVDPVQDSTGAENAGCIAGASASGRANVIDGKYRTPYAIHVSAGVQRAITEKWSLSADYIHEQGNHAYRAYSYTGGVNLFTPELALTDPLQAAYVPNVSVFRSDNRSSYNGLLIHLQGDVTRRVNLIANYTLASARTWGCTLGELFDYVNGVCDPLQAFAPGDDGPSGEDVRHRVVLAGSWQAPAGLVVSGLSQAESARPFTITTTDNSNRIAVNGVKTSLDQFRAIPYIQTDLRIARPIKLADRLTIMPFIEAFNLFNRNNPGANFITNAASLPVPEAEAQAGNITDLCTNADCSVTQPIHNLKQLGFPAGALGDFFGPGTTVGAPFAAQVGARITF